MATATSSRTFADGGNGHVEFVAAMLGFTRRAEEQAKHAVVHHMVLNRQTLDEMFQDVTDRVKETKAGLGNGPVGAGGGGGSSGGGGSGGGDVATGELPSPGSGWDAWMVFVQLFDAHHTMRATLFTHDPPALPNMTTTTLHETSEYELYDTYAFERWVGSTITTITTIATRKHHIIATTVTSTPHSLCDRSSKGGRDQAPSVARRQLSFADVGSCCFYPDGGAVAGCNVEAMHDDLAGIYNLDYVACHGPMRKRALPGTREMEIDY